MKKFRIECLFWVDGSGWDCNSTIDNVDEKIDIDEYAKEYFADMEIKNNEDYQLVLIENESNNKISCSDWASKINK